ncbi:hypothetical protein CC86DRAFT_75699 [Ophiobolus disseminans]|uniref:Cytochrome P450 n=1 Tax=Ophiobolus disseminans TaxID=1469910 RepID=A0A6A6ZS10_9PLEO|nr:hypothetical protein CC86DRAFT_75699 [Ophiobolus disseminans]
MYETVRLFGVPPPWRSVAMTEPRILVNGPDGTMDLDLPPGTQVSLNVFACHTSPEWCDDGEVWDPKRWIQQASVGVEEQLVINDKRFFGWGAGPRVCPGQIVPASKDDEGEEVAGDAIRKLVAASAASLTVYLPEPEKLWFKFVKR